MSANITGVFLRQVVGRDGAFRFDFVSAGADTYLGISAARLMEEPELFFERLHPDHRAAYCRALSESERNLTPLVVEFRAVGAEGSWLRSSSHPFVNPLGEVVWDVFLQDVSDRKRAADALLTATLRTNAILEAMVDAVITTDPGGLIDSFNAAAESCFGFDATEVIGRSVDTLIPGVLTQAGACHGLSRAATWELVGRHRDGSEFPLELTRSEIELEGTLVVLVARDITLRRAVEADMARLNAIVHSTSDFVGWATPDGIVRYVNPAGMRLLGLPRDLKAGELKLSECFAAWGYPQMIEEAIPSALLHGLWQGESALVSFDTGREIPVSQVVLVGRDGAGGPAFIATICRDIGGHKALERNLAEARERAEVANSTKSAFLAAMSHELRTPLNAINGFSQLLLLNEKEPLAKIQRQQIITIRRAGEHLLKLIEDILDLAKIEGGRLSVAVEPVSLSTIALEACEGLAELAAHAGITLEMRGAEVASPLVQGDRTRVIQVVVNLISNAIKYNPAGGAVHVSVECRPERRVRLSVRDTGSGIPLNRHGEVFQAFNRLGAELGVVEGTGIGLALSRTLAELMGGTLAFVSAPGQGSTFWIELPGWEDLSAPL